MSGEVMSKSQPSTSAFSTSQEIAFERQADCSDDAVEVDEALVEIFFDIQQCIKFVEGGQFQRVALQFPDGLLGYSARVVTRLADCCPESQIAVMADTSYGSCCVDEVAAEHMNADAIIHFGHSCLSSVRRLPVLYVFGREQMDIMSCAEMFRQTFSDSQQRIVLLADVIFHHLLEELASCLRPTYPCLYVSELTGTHPRLLDGTVGVCRSCMVAGQNVRTTGSASKTEDTPVDVYTRCGRLFELPAGASLSDCSVFYVGLVGLALNNLMMSLNRCPFYLYNPRSREVQHQTLQANRQLKRRYVMMLKAKEARVVGLLAGTLGVENYADIMARLKRIMRQAGKKVYTFSLGKLNAAKLANFMEIDVFVLVACSENSLISSEDFYKPVVTPFEMEVACLRARSWTGDYVTDFRHLLPGSSDYVPADEEGDNEEEPEFSLISGSLLQRGVCKKESTRETAQSDALVRRAPGELVAANSAGAAFLASRSWQGLEPQLGQTPVGEIIEGRSGIAASYSHEEGFSRTQHSCCSGSLDGCLANSTSTCQS